MPELPASLKKDTNCDDRDNKGDLSPKKSTKLSRSPGDRAADTEVYDERCQIGQKRRKLGADPSKGDAQSPTREEWMSLPTKQLEEMFGSGI